ncbi:MAG: hypothetical protein ACXWRE_13265 [Pseudobdellovibrionaceae bacterium]
MVATATGLNENYYHEDGSDLPPQNVVVAVSIASVRLGRFQFCFYLSARPLKVSSYGNFGQAH